MPFCRECGKSLEEEWKNCPHCGESTSVINIRNNETTPLSHQTIVVGKETKTDSGDIIIGIICLFIAAVSYAEYSSSICGTVLAPLANDCASWEAFNLICGGFGIIAILLGLRGKPIK